MCIQLNKIRFSASLCVTLQYPYNTLKKLTNKKEWERHDGYNTRLNASMKWTEWANSQFGDLSLFWMKNVPSFQPDKLTERILEK